MAANEVQIKEGGLARAGEALTRWTERWIPDALVIVFILSIVAYVLALLWGFKPAMKIEDRLYGGVVAWGKGFWAYLGFAMQMCLIMMTGYILALSPPVRRLLDGLARLPNQDRPGQAIVVMALFSTLSAWVSWGLSIIGSAVLALFIVRRNPKVDYRLLVAAAYLGLGCTWHSGLTGSATLMMASPGNALVKSAIAKGWIAGPISTGETIFHPFNLILTAVVIILVTWLMARMHPAPEHTYVVQPELMERLKLYEPPTRSATKTFSDFLNWWWGFNIIIAAGGAVALYTFLVGKPLGAWLNLNNVIFFFLMLGILFHWRPWSFLMASMEAGKAVWGIIIQFPFYAGIYGLIAYTDLAQVLTNAFVAFSSAATFPMFAYWYAGVLNYLVPSGGGEWLMTAPYLLPAGKALGLPAYKTVIAYAWGDMMTDMIQPFWAIAMLAVAKLNFRDIMGYLMIIFLAYFVVTSIGFLILPWI
ncbi:MAG: short-chain fatty acid transporter [Desulfarculus sp.]|jgi:short-chain fatty acids transporter|nr:MAG: short-chain fatty acid transporter [Desulfarculus sp.]